MGRTHNNISNLQKSKSHCLGPAGSAAQVKAGIAALAGRWKIEILFALMSHDGPCRYSMLERDIDGISQKMLAQQLRELERDGLICRQIYPEIPPKVEYSLSESGSALREPLRALKILGQTLQQQDNDKTQEAEN
ncbi:winged helix-turn-helix transcriptional regulator [Thalassospira marina]|uniref:winged helix-turn-helix transcriptional regulator n=1 Tax=Thalassospira marina TaxID=2048283 RepID=UPI0020C258D8|nr:winged helix-turn-helix transcriptional regulator [Thalassospira marina]